MAWRLPYTGAMTRAAAIQMVSSPDVDRNLAEAETLIARAAAEGAEFALLPENFSIMGREDTDKLRYREPLGNGPQQRFLADQARRHELWLMGGTIPLESGHENHILSGCLLFNPAGERVAVYYKIHLFDVSVDSRTGESYKESNTIVPGSDIVVAETPFGNIGMSVCYDLRFPELYRRMLDRDISIITVPSAFTETTGRRHWEVLLRSRAVENLCYVIASNQGGQNTETRATWGHSMIIDPWGDILGRMEKGPGVVCADIDTGRVRELRRQFPAIEHRKFI